MSLFCCLVVWICGCLVVWIWWCLRVVKYLITSCRAPLSDWSGYHQVAPSVDSHSSLDLIINNAHFDSHSTSISKYKFQNRFARYFMTNLSLVFKSNFFWISLIQFWVHLGLTQSLEPRFDYWWSGNVWGKSSVGSQKANTLDDMDKRQKSPPS